MTTTNQVTARLARTETLRNDRAALRVKIGATPTTTETIMDRLTAETITSRAIAKLHDEAMAAGDYAMECTCRAALNDHGTVTADDVTAARQRCAEAVNAARAEDDSAAVQR